jgi:hypothetical protein
MSSSLDIECYNIECYKGRYCALFKQLGRSLPVSQSSGKVGALKLPALHLVIHGSSPGGSDSRLVGGVRGAGLVRSTCGRCQPSGCDCCGLDNY